MYGPVLYLSIKITFVGIVPSLVSFTLIILTPVFFLKPSVLRLNDANTYWLMHNYRGTQVDE